MTRVVGVKTFLDAANVAADLQHRFANSSTVAIFKQKVTRVVGVETFLLDAASVAADLQKRFAASATVAELPGDKSKGHYEVVLQVG